MNNLHGLCQKFASRFKRWISLLLSIVLIFSNCQVPAFAENMEAYQEYLDGWYVQCAWNNLSQDYIWNAEYSQSMQPKIIATYRIKNAEKDYPAGSICFTIPGIGNAYRGTLKKASELAADKSDSEWNYTWDENTDTYTFTNKFTVTTGQSVSGGFELMWSYNARDCEDGFTQSKSPTFSVKNAGTITMEPLNYSFTSVRDKYRIYLTQDKLSASQFDQYDREHIWYYFNTRFDNDYKARGLYKSSYYISIDLPDNADASDLVAYYGGKKQTLTENEDGTLGFYVFKDSTADYISGSRMVLLGFEKNVLQDKVVTVHGHLDRLYNDESEWTTSAGDNEIVDVEAQAAIGGYEFYYTGYIYAHEKYNLNYERLNRSSTKDTPNYWRTDYSDHSAPTVYSDRLNATKLFDGKIVEYDLWGKARRDYSSAAAASLSDDDGIAVASLDDEISAMSLDDELTVASASNVKRKNSVKSSVKTVAVSDDEELPVSDWDDLNWKENGLYEVETLDGPTYAELHPDSVSLGDLDGVEEEEDESEGSTFLKKIENAVSKVFNKSTKDSVDTSSMEATAEMTVVEAEANETAATETEVDETAANAAETKYDTETTVATEAEKETTEAEKVEETEISTKADDTVEEPTEKTDAAEEVSDKVADDENTEDADTAEEKDTDSKENTSLLSKVVSKIASLFSMEAQAAEADTATASDAERVSNDGIMAADLSGETSGKTTKPGGNSTGISQVEENQEYSLVLGDDMFWVTQNNGLIRSLDGDEYEISYVRFPHGLGYEYEIYGTQTLDTHFDDYVLIAEGDGAYTDEVVKLPSGVKAFFIRVNGIVGSYEYEIKLGVRFHLDWDEEMQKPAAERVNTEDKIANFSYLRALYVDEDGYEVNDCATADDNYLGSGGSAIANRDKQVYGEYLFRDYSHVWLRSPVTELTSETDISSFAGKPKTGYTTTITSSGTLQADNEGEFKSFSLYTIIPNGLNFDLDEDEIVITGSGKTLTGETLNDFQNHATVSTKTVNGQMMIVTDFDFTDEPLDATQLVNASVRFPARLSYADFQAYGHYYRVESYLMPHDSGLAQISGPAIKADEYDYDGNNRTEDQMAFSYDVGYAYDSATEWREFVSKYIKSAYSGGFVTDTATRLYSDSDTDEMKAKSDYQYRLDFGLGSSNAKDIIFFDHIEQGATLSAAGDKGDTTKTVESEWQGSLVSVDTTQAEKLGLIPTIYYSTDAKQEFNLASSGWTTEKPSDMSTVKSVAIALDTSKMPDGVMKTKQMAYVILNMRAPSDRNLVDKKAVNQYDVTYAAYGLTNRYEDTYTLPSAETYVKLLDNIGKIILQKVDADNLLSTSEDGTKKYANLTGAKIQVYDSNGKALFGKEGTEVNSIGRLVVRNIRQGKYTWEEVQAPKGYQKIEGKHDFDIDGVTSVINIENHRIPGSVTLTKQDSDDASYGPLAGATFTLHKSDGTEIFTDGDYVYSETGTNRTFTTSTDGTLTVTNLPWGSYYFKETQAPNGYVLPDQNTSFNNINFSIGQNQYDETTNTVHADINVSNSELTASITLQKLDSDDGRAIKGALFDVYKVEETTDKLVEHNLKTNATGEITVSNLKFGEYYFKETQRANGYLLPAKDKLESEHVVLDASTAEKNITVSMTNDRKLGIVILSKTDDAGQYVGGAEYTLYRKAENEDHYTAYGTYTTVNDKDQVNYGEISVENLPWGDYFFVETKAPKGYVVSSEHIEFTVNKDTVENTIYLYTIDNRATGRVKLTKVDKCDHRMLLSGATYELYRTDGTKCVLGTDYKVSGDTASITTGADGTVTITDIKQGAYYLKELTAPTSYTLSDELIRFSITKENADVVQDLTAEDEAGKAVIKINKKINESYKPFGDPTFIFRVKRDDGMTYEKSITLSDTETEGSVTFMVDQGHSYDISEINVSRYKLKEATGIENVTITNQIGTADLITNDKAEITFVNEITQYEKFSHESNAKNLVKSSTKLTGISVEYIGINPITSGLPGYSAIKETYTIPKEDLVVTAFYDDGTSNVLTASEYKLTPDTVDGNSNSYTGTVTYTESGVTKHSTFQLDVDLPAAQTRYHKTYRVMIYGIGEDEDEDGNKTGLTFGPVVGVNVSDSVAVSHDASGYEKCIADMSWEEIVEQSKTDPTVFQGCLENGCTKDIDLVISGKLADTSKTFPYNYPFHDLNDYNESSNGFIMNGYYRRWNNPFADSSVYVDADGQQHSTRYADNGTVNGGWPDSKIRNTLNGVLTDEIIKNNIATGQYQSGTNYQDNKFKEYALDETNSVLSCFPSVLKDAIVSKKVKSVVYDVDQTGALSENSREAITYDKLWLFSLSELGELNTSSISVPMADEGNEYSRISYLRENFGSEWNKDYVPGLKFANNSYCWLRSTLKFSGSSYASIAYANYDYVNAYNAYHDHAIFPGFCLPGPEEKVTTLSSDCFRQSYFANLTAIKRTASAPTDAIKALDSFKLVSEYNSDYPCYAWVLNDVMYYYTEANKIYAPSNMNYMFSQCKKLVDISGLKYLDTSKCINFAGEFIGCTSLTDLSPIADWDVSNAFRLDYMFNDCTSLTDVSTLSKWKIGGADLGFMFYNSGIASVNGIGSWDVSNITCTYYMFARCANLKDASDLVNWGSKLPEDIYMDHMFYCSGLENIGFLKTWKLGKARNYNGMVENCISLKNLDGLENWDPGKISFSYFFVGTGLEDISAAKDWNMSQVTSVDSMFSNCDNLSNIGELNWNLSNVTSLNNTFYNCTNLTNLGTLNWNVSNVTSMWSTFQACSNLTNVDGLAKWDVGKVNRMCSVFKGCNKLEDLSGLANWNVSNMVDTESMFDCEGYANEDGTYGNFALKSLHGLENWDVRNVTNAYRMFNSCKALADLTALKEWRPSNLTTAGKMFKYCTSIETLSGLEDWDTSNVGSIYEMFEEDSGLTDATAISGWNIDKCTSFSDMFRNTPIQRVKDKLPAWNGTWDDYGSFTKAS